MRRAWTALLAIPAALIVGAYLIYRVCYLPRHLRRFKDEAEHVDHTNTGS